MKIRGKPFSKGQSGNPHGRPPINPSFNKQERNKDTILKSKYGIGLREYREILDKQGGVCAICGNPEEKEQSRGNNKGKNKDSLHVDHDHITGHVRGLLCYRCNTGIGKLRDDANILRKAARYLSYAEE